MNAAQPAAQPPDRCHRAARGTQRPIAARAQRSEQGTGTAVVIAGLLRRREMQHRRREAGKPFQAAARVEITDQRRDARSAQFGAAPGVASEREDMRVWPQQGHAAHADVTAANYQNARPA